MRHPTLNRLDGPAVERHHQAEVKGLFLAGSVLTLLSSSLGLFPCRSSSLETSFHL